MNFFSKAASILNRIYGLLLTASFFGGGLPLFGFIAALIVGGDTGASISTFLYKKYYPVVILCASIAVIIGLLSTYLSKIGNRKKS